MSANVICSTAVSTRWLSSAERSRSNLMPRHQRRPCRPWAPTRLNPPRMRAVIQRVSSATVTVENRVVGAIELGLLVYVGITHADGAGETDYMANKIVGLRLFADADGRFSRSVRDVSGAVLLVSQFTLYGDYRKGRRPSFDKAAPPEQAAALCECFVKLLEEQGLEVAQGEFGAHMMVEINNDGPVTLMVENS